MGLNEKLLSELFLPLTDSVSLKLEERKNQRDNLNQEVRIHLNKRNEINRQVKELITEVQNQKTIRDEANSKVRNLKDIRLEKSNHLKELRSGLRKKIKENSNSIQSKRKGRPSSKIRADMDKFERKYETGQISSKKEKDFFSKMKNLTRELKEAVAYEEQSSSLALKEVRKAEKNQEDAHKSVEKAVDNAQEAHDLMIELSEEVDRLRGLANTEQKSVTETKKKADKLHNQYIVSLRCIHSMQDMIKIYESKKDSKKGTETVEVTELMDKLMSGDTLSTDEIMSLQRS